MEVGEDNCSMLRRPEGLSCGSSVCFMIPKEIFKIHAMLLSRCKNVLKALLLGESRKPAAVRNASAKTPSTFLQDDRSVETIVQRMYGKVYKPRGGRLRACRY